MGASSFFVWLEVSFDQSRCSWGSGSSVGINIQNSLEKGNAPAGQEIVSAGQGFDLAEYDLPLAGQETARTLLRFTRSRVYCISPFLKMS